MTAYDYNDDGTNQMHRVVVAKPPTPQPWIILSPYEQGWEAVGPFPTRAAAEAVTETWEDDAYVILLLQPWED